MWTREGRDSLNSCSVLIAAVFFCLALGCAANKNKVKVPTAEEAKKQAKAQGPLVPEPVEKRYNFPPGQAAGVKNGTTVTTTDGKTVTWGAVVLDEDKAKRYAVIKAERDRLRKDLEDERLKSRARKIIYDKTLEKIKQENAPTWWGKHKWSILAPTLISIGGAVVIGIVYALTKGNGITVNTNAVVLPPVHR